MIVSVDEVVAGSWPRATGRDRLPLRLEIRNSADRSAVMAQWQSLEIELGHARLTSSAVWVATWLRHFGSQIPHRFLIARRGDIAVGICLVTESIEWFGPIPIRTLHVGTAGERDADSVCVEFNSILVGAAEHVEFLNLIQRHLARANADAVSWDGFAPEEVPCGLIDNVNWQTVARPTMYFDLDRVRFDEVEPITQLGDSTRKTIRQNLRDLGKVEVDWSETPQQIDEYYSKLIELHQARWQLAGKPGCFASRSFREFHEDLLHRLVPLGRAAMVRVRAGAQIIGCTLLHIDQNRALVYQGGWASDSAKSPGVVNDYCCLVECLRRRLSAYDFMAGDSIHKRRMTTHQGELVWALNRLTPWKFESIEWLRSAKKWLGAWSIRGKEPI